MLEQIITKEVISPIFIVIIAILFYSFIKKVVIKMFRASSKFGVHKKSMTIMNLIINIIKYIIILVALLAMLNVWGVDTKALVASLGIAGVVAGLALQDILKDFL
ncbi:MAG: mechanosensitive ion channel, partial [Bacilli bacterium]|nr:mechanosensitive ion channel [Bacilli bacterium]